MPGAGHLVHMPSHIYYRVGRYIDQITKANEAGGHRRRSVSSLRCRDRGKLHVVLTTPTMCISMMVSAQMAGDGKTAVAAAEKLAARGDRRRRPGPSRAQADSSGALTSRTPSSARPATVAALPEPATELPVREGNVALRPRRGPCRPARTSRRPSAAADGDRWPRGPRGLSPHLAAGGDARGRRAGTSPARRCWRASHRRKPEVPEEADARRARAGGRHLQDKLPLHGAAALVLSGAPVARRRAPALGWRSSPAAEEAFRASLVWAPNNGWALYGLGQVYSRAGRKQELAEIVRRLDKSWAGNWLLRSRAPLEMVARKLCLEPSK